jgi:hypothetical protein
MLGVDPVPVATCCEEWIVNDKMRCLQLATLKQRALCHRNLKELGGLYPCLATIHQLPSLPARPLPHQPARI